MDEPLGILDLEAVRRFGTQHGGLTEVVFLTHYPEFGIEFRFADGATQRSGKRQGRHDIHFLSYGYGGEGPRYLEGFLQALEWAVAFETLVLMRPSFLLRRAGEDVFIQALSDDDAPVVLLERNGKITLAARELLLGRAIGRLAEAARVGDSSVVSSLLADGADPGLLDEEGMTPLMLALQGGFADVAELLLVAGADSNQPSGRTPRYALAEVISSSVTPVIQQAVPLLLDAGANVELGGPLAAAARRGLIEVVELLLSSGANPNGSDGKSPLTELEGGDDDASAIGIARMLLDGGADPMSLDEYGRSALHNAALRSNPTVCRMLLDSDGEVGAKDRFGDTPLHFAAGGTYSDAPMGLETVETLLAAGADPNTRGKWSMTPLHKAAGKRGNVELCRILFEAGADPEARDEGGNSAIAHAGQSDERMANILCYAGDDSESRGERLGYAHLAVREQLVKCVNEGDLDSALLHSDRMIRLFDAQYSRFRLTDIQVDRAAILNSLDRGVEAVRLCDEVLDADETYLAAWYNKGVALRGLARQDEAVECYDRAILIDAERSMVWQAKANCLLDLSMEREALVCLERCLVLDPSNETVRAERNRLTAMAE